MNPRDVHAVLAAGVDDPALITRWRQDPSRLLNHGVQPGSIDLDRLWKFAGLMAKVRHNPIRGDLPLTFRLLDVTGTDIELFACYAADRAARRCPLAGGADGRARELVEFLEHWLDRARREHVLLWDVIRHERAIAQLKNAAPPARTQPVARAPRIRGVVLLLETWCNPRHVAAELYQRRPALENVPLEATYLGYWRAGAAPEISVLQLDEFGFYALSLIDGARSVAGLSRALGGSRRPTRGFMRLLRQLAAVGVVELPGTSRRGG